MHRIMNMTHGNADDVKTPPPSTTHVSGAKFFCTYLHNILSSLNHCAWLKYYHEIHFRSHIKSCFVFRVRGYTLDKGWMDDVELQRKRKHFKYLRVLRVACLSLSPHLGGSLFCVRKEEEIHSRRNHVCCVSASYDENRDATKLLS